MYVSTDGSWGSYVPFNEGLCTMAMTRPTDLFNKVAVKDSSFKFGVTTWASAEANSLTGYYEQVYSVAIPRWAQDVEHSAFLMADLFEGLDINGQTIETYEDVLDWYRDEYFDSDIDLECMVREGATLQYSYWPGTRFDVMWNELSDNLLTSGSVTTLIKRYVGSIEKDTETHVVPNQVALYQWKDQLNAD